MVALNDQEQNDQKQKNNEVAKEVQNIMEGLTNENVQDNQDRKLDIWCLIFSRILKTDGKRMLCSHDIMRFNVKQRAHEALAFHLHPVKELAEWLIIFLEQIEFYDISPEDIVEVKQL